MDRFDIPTEVKNVINAAIENKLIDAFDIYGLATEYADNWKDLVERIALIAYAGHYDNWKGHCEVTDAADKFFAKFNA